MGVWRRGLRGMGCGPGAACHQACPHNPAMDELQQIEAGLAALEAQRALLGDAVVEMAAAPLRTRLAALQAAQAASVQQLRQVSVLFVDAVGSTALGRQLDPEDIQAVMDGALGAFTAIVQAHRGRVLQYTGDGLLAAFGTEEAHEDDPEQAVRAGLGILAETRRRAGQVRQQFGLDGFEVRAGVHTGPVLLGGGVDAEGTIRGTTVNLAARMEQSAPPGGLRISHDTYHHVRGRFRMVEQPPITVKGSEQPMLTYLVQAVRPSSFRMAGRGIEGVSTPMVAREAELELLQDSLEQAVRGPAFVSVIVVSEAGLGKTRLLHEFESWVESRPRTCEPFRGRAQPHAQGQPYSLLRDLVAWRLQINEADDDADTVRTKLTDGIAPLFADDGTAQAHLLGQLIGLDFSASPHVRGVLDDARQLRNRGFHALAQWLRLSAAASGAPVLVLLDDLQWADDGSLEFLQYLGQVNRDVPTLLLCMARPTLFERQVDWARLESVVRRIELEPLDKRASRELVNLLLQRLDSVPAALRELVLGGAEGNPFYMEELVRMLIDSGAIVTDAQRWQVQPDKLLAAQVPSTLTGLLQARLDSLAAPEKLALQQAAVIGFVFWEQALRALDQRSVPALAAPLQRGLVMPRDQAVVDDGKAYVFKHQILHQVTYESLLKRLRRDYHAQVAAWLAQLDGDRAIDLAGLAAEHFERAGDALNACRFHTQAAEHAAARYANQAMLDHVARGLALAAADDHAIRWRLLTVREAARLHQGDRAAHGADLDALDALAEAQDDDTWRAAVRLRRAVASNDSGDFVAAADQARRGLQRLPPGSDVAMAVKLHSSLANALVGQGEHATARTVAEQGLAQAQAGRDRVGECSLINVLGLIAMEQGDLTVAAGHFERSLVIAREIGNRGTEGLRLSNLGSVYPRLGQYAQARKHLDDALRVARATGRRDVEALVLLNTASVAHLQGDDAAALAFANAALRAASTGGQRDLAAYAHLVLGHAELGLGRHAAARAAYTASRDLLVQLQMRRQQTLDPVSGLVRVALAEGHTGEALALAEAIVAHLGEGGSLDGTEEPLLIPLTAYRALRAAGDGRADAVLAAAFAELQAQAARITDAPARLSFLQAVPHHHEIVAAWGRGAAGGPVAPPA